jgi:hypothetical protein
MDKPLLRNRDAADIYVDNPDEAMDQFRDGLRRVLSAPKPKLKPKPRARKRKERR